MPSQTFCDTEIRALEAAGHEIEIYSCSAPTTSFRHGGPADWPRAEVLYAPPGPVLEALADAARRGNGWPGAMVAEHESRFGPRHDPARRARHALYFADRLRRRGVQHLHVHFANRATHAALFIHELTGIPFSFTAHAQDFLVDLGNYDLLRLLCARAAFVVTVSDWSRRALVERCPAAEAKVCRVYNGLELDRWPSPASTPSRSSDAALKIFSVGRLITFKGFHDLIAACWRLRERGVPFSCDIAGEGPSHVALAAQAAGLDAPDASVRLLGLLPQEEIRVRLAACDVFALPCCVDEKGACDVLPTVILEAMAAGRPVVSTRLAAVPEMVQEGETGLLVPPGDPAAFGDALAKLAADPGESHRMGTAGRARVVADFSATDSARQLGALFADGKSTGTLALREKSEATSGPGVFCLFERWPPAPPNDISSLYHAMLTGGGGTLPGTQVLALRPGVFSEPSEAGAGGQTASLLQAIEYLPDDVVFETYWRRQTPTVFQLESWRGEAGGGCAPDAFFLACRRALYLRHTLLADSGGGRHLHAVGPQALLCVWLLRRLGAADAVSFLLPSITKGGVGVAGSTLRRLAPEFVGGWVVREQKLAASLGAGFRAETPDGDEWTRVMKQWTGLGSAI